MSRDSIFSYVHIDDPNQILHMERWQDDPIPFDDIDTQSLFDSTLNILPNFFFEEEDDNNLLINSLNFGLKFFKNKKKFLKEKIWNDLNLFDKFLNDESPENIDKTILKSIYTKNTNNNEIIESNNELTIGEFLSNGYNLTNNLDNLLLSSDLINDSIMNNNNNDISINSISDLNNNTFLNLRSNSITQQTQQQPLQLQQPQPQFQTPRMVRTRQSSTDRNYQTPITRIMR